MLKKNNTLKYYEENIQSNVLTVKPFKETEVPWFFDVEFDSKQIKDEFKEYLDKNGIETRDFYPALSSQKYLDVYKSDNLEYSENIYNRLLWLPSGNNMKAKSSYHLFVKLFQGLNEYKHLFLYQPNMK